jgi:hypothetical protein
MIAFVLFFLTGLAFGFAAPGAWALASLAIPTFFAVMDAFANGVDAHLVLTFAIAVALTVIGIFAGRALADRAENREAAY